MQLSFAMTLRVKVGVPIDVGLVAGGRRRIVAIDGGTFEGPGLRGVVLAGGADWQIIRADGVTELDARYTLRTDAGEVVYVRNTGIRHAPADVMQKLLGGEDVDPALVYFRTVPVFETAAPRLTWLPRTVFVASGERHPDEVVLHVSKIE